MATESSIGLPPDSTGKKLRSTEVTTAQGTVEQQVLNIGDPTTAANMLAVAADGSAAARLRDGAGNALTSTLAAGKTGLDVAIAADPDTVAIGTITAVDAVVAAPAGAGALLSGASTANSYVTVACPGGDSAWNLQVTGAFGGATVYFEESLDSTTGVDGNWIAVNGRQTGVINTLLSNGTTVAGVYRGNTSGAKYLRARAVGGAAPNLAIVIRMSSGVGAIFLNAGLPPGSDTIGTVRTADGAGTPVTSTLAGTKQSLDVNLGGSGSGLPQTAGVITAAVANTPGAPVTASTSAQVVANVGLAGNITFHVVAAAFVGTLIFEASVDGGLNYSPVQAIREDGSGSETSTSLSVAAAFIRQYTTALPGMSYFRVRCSAYTSGSAAIAMAPGAFLVEPNPSLATSSSVIGQVAPVDSLKPTYIAYFDALSANIAGDVFVLLGSATKTIKISRVEVSIAGGGTITAAQNYLRLALRTTANTGGTTTPATFTKLDPNDPTQTATAVGYTVAATGLGTGTVVRRQNYLAAAAGTAAAPPMWTWDFGNRPEKMPIVRGTSQSFVVTNSAVAAGTSPTLSWSIYVQFTEE